MPLSDAGAISTRHRKKTVVPSPRKTGTDGGSVCGSSINTTPRKGKRAGAERVVDAESQVVFEAEAQATKKQRVLVKPGDVCTCDVCDRSSEDVG